MEHYLSYSDGNDFVAGNNVTIYIIIIVGSNE